MSRREIQDDERVLTVREVAGLLRVDPPTVTRWIRVGLLVAHKTPGGRDWRLLESDALAMTRGEYQPPGGES